jgi:hypothetical protein
MSAEKQADHADMRSAQRDVAGSPIRPRIGGPSQNLPPQG